ncbi:6426_t:CDS:1, partial [Entrophospora sp. SA101]
MSEKDFTDEEQSAAASVLISQVCRCAYGSLLAKSTAILPLATSPSSSSSQTRSLQPPSSTKEEIITKEITINFNDTGSENNNNNSVIVENTD